MLVGGSILEEIPIVNPNEIELETERFILKPISMDDADEIYQNVKDYDIARWLISLPHPYPKDGAIKYIGEVMELSKKGLSYEFPIRLRSTGELVGVMAILKVDRKNRNTELGYWIAKKYWNSGFATEAGLRALQFGFEVLNLERIYAKYYPENKASAKVMEKMGMKFEGTMRHEIYKNGKFYDMSYYGILKDEWKK
jgi:RimJ/RimL family protein N-acetyltransferase